VRPVQLEVWGESLGLMDFGIDLPGAGGSSGGTWVAGEFNRRADQHAGAGGAGGRPSLFFPPYDAVADCEGRRRWERFPTLRGALADLAGKVFRIGYPAIELRGGRIAPEAGCGGTRIQKGKKTCRNFPHKWSFG